MSLQINFNTDSGLTAASAYARIAQVSVHTPRLDTNNALEISVIVYASFEDYTNHREPIGRINAVSSFDETQSLSKADLYTWLKTQPGFEGAIDV